MGLAQVWAETGTSRSRRRRGVPRRRMRRRVRHIRDPTIYLRVFRVRYELHLFLYLNFFFLFLYGLFILIALLLLLEYLNFCSLFFELLFSCFLGAYLCMYVSSFSSVFAIYFWFWGYQLCCFVILSHYNRCIQMVHLFIYTCIYYFSCWGVKL